MGFSRLIRKVAFDFEAFKKKDKQDWLGGEGFGFEAVVRRFLLFMGFDGFQRILILMEIRSASVTVSFFISLIHWFDWYS